MGGAGGYGGDGAAMLKRLSAAALWAAPAVCGGDGAAMLQPSCMSLDLGFGSRHSGISSSLLFQISLTCYALCAKRAKKKSKRLLTYKRN